MFITARIASIFVSSAVVHINDFIYLQSLLNVFSIRIPFQRFNRLRMGAAFPSQNDHLLSKQGIVWLFFWLYLQVTPHLKNRKRISKGQMLARKGESADISALWEKTVFCKIFIQNLLHSYRITFECHECWK